MGSLDTLKDRARETRLVRARLVASAVGAGLAMALLIARLVELQVIDFEHFRTLSEDNRVRVEPVAPTRGLIYDRNGVILAENVPAYSLDVVPEAAGDIDRLLERIGRLVRLEPGDIERFRRALAKARRFDRVPLRLRLSEDEVARFSVNRHRFPGVEVRARLTRRYPLGALTAHLVGYVGRIDERELRTLDEANYRGTTHVGKTGVEQAFEGLLHGRAGYQHVETNARGRTLRVLDRVDPAPGVNLYLSVDVALQAAAERALGGRNGSVVAIDPVSGAILALVSLPAYDPNLFVDGIDRKSYAELLASRDRPLFNRALRGRYPPGSTIKPFLGLAGLEFGTEKARGTVWCPGWFSLPGSSYRYRDWKKGGHGRVDLRKAIVESCDVFFYELALELGIDRIHDFLSRFGFGQRSGVALAGESAGLLPSRAWKRRVRNQPWYPGETLITGIGQGYMLATPLQLAVATAALAMRGLRMRPRVLEREVAADGSQRPVGAETLESIELRRPEQWQEVIDAMVEVVHGPRGTARRIGRGATYRIAGKTGTAQVFSLGQDEKYREEELAPELRDHGLFIAFAPAESPRIAVAVVVENGGSGSRSAAPVAREVLDQYLLRGPGGKPGRKGLLLTRAALARDPSPAIP